MKTTLDGKKAGLQDARSMKVENEERRIKESKMLDGVSPIYFYALKIVVYIKVGISARQIQLLLLKISYDFFGDL